MKNFGIKKYIAAGFFAAFVAAVTASADTQVLTSVSVSPSSASVTAASTTQLSALPLDQNGAAYTATNTATWSSDDTAVATVDNNGLVTGVSAGTSTISVSVTDGTGTVSGSGSVTVSAAAPTVRTVNFKLRNSSSVIWNGQVSVPDSGTATTTVTATDGTTSTVYAASALAALISADGSSTDFSVSNLIYYPSFSSFYIKCIMASSELCDNWQYAVNDAVPDIGADQYKLSDGQNLVFFYGTKRRVVLSSSTIIAGSQVTVTAQGYKPSDDTYVPAPGVTVGATQPDPSNPWSQIEFATSTTDPNGQAVLTLNATGTYQMGIKEDYYSPSVDLVVNPVPLQIQGGTAPIIQTHHSVDTARAVQFLLSSELSDGSFGPLLYTDWAAMALAANGSVPSDRLNAYIVSANGGMSSATDYERHAMALMSLGIDPYGGTPVNYIQKILDKFDGTQVGDPGLVNDDIFSLFPLVKSGYGFGDVMMQKIVSFILSKQGSDGSWEGGVDMTAAAVQALSPAVSVNGVQRALSAARAYLVSQQRADGGFGSGYSTSWAVQAVSSLREPAYGWNVNGNNPYDYLWSLQAGDGGIESTSTSANSRIWATSYAIPASLNKNWYDILTAFSKPAASQQVSSSVPPAGSVANIAATSTATTTAIIAATTSSSSALTAVTSSIAITATTTEEISKSDATGTVSFVTQTPRQSKTARVPENRLKELVKTAGSGQRNENKVPSKEGNKTSGNGGLADMAAAIGGRIFGVAENIGGLIVAKIFSIISFIK